MIMKIPTLTRISELTETDEKYDRYKARKLLIVLHN